MPGSLAETPIEDEFLFEEDFTEDDWLEAVDDKRVDVVSRDRSLCTVNVYVPYANYKSAIRFMLGYSWVDQDKKLRREIPVFHPQWTWLWARAITGVEFLKFKSKAEASTGYVKAVALAEYQWAKVSLEFAEVRYEIHSDDNSDVEYEYQRYVEKRYKPYGEILQIDGGQLKAYAPSVPAVNAQPFISAPFVLARPKKSCFTLTWYEVPREFIEDSDGRQPKLEAMCKAVNSVTFMGYRAGTLLCEDIDTVPSPAPIATDLQERLAFTVDVTMTFKRFDPTPGDPAVEKYGWQLLPGPRNTTGAAGDTVGAYFYYTHDGTLGGKPIYEEYDFNNAFTHHSI
jgi:hypothetical protein